MQEIRTTLSGWLMQACEALHRMRCCKADNMLDFADRDPASFVMLVDAMYGMGSLVTPEVADRWQNMKRSTLGAGRASRAAIAEQSAGGIVS